MRGDDPNHVNQVKKFCVRTFSALPCECKINLAKLFMRFNNGYNSSIVAPAMKLQSGFFRPQSLQASPLLGCEQKRAAIFQKKDFEGGARHHLKFELNHFSSK
jgi:hypothetical protein